MRLVRYVTVDDVGRIVNPMIVEGQVHGGIAQGVGQALFEDCVYDPQTGQLVSGSFMDYCHAAGGRPAVLRVVGDGIPATSNPVGIKGAGECGTTPATAAVLNAIVDALGDLGIRIWKCRATAERIWRAVRSPHVQ